MLKIKLRLSGETKEYTQDFISGYLFRRAVDLDDKRNKYMQEVLKTQGDIPAEKQKALLDELYDFVSTVFDQKFTAEEYEKGADARQIIDQSWAIVHGIIGQVMEPLNQPDGNGNNKKKRKKQTQKHS